MASSRQKGELSAEWADAVMADPRSDGVLVRFRTVTGLAAVSNRLLWATVNRKTLAMMLKKLRYTDTEETDAALKRVISFLEAEYGTK